MPIWRGNEIITLDGRAKLVIMNALDQILRPHRLPVFRQVNRPGKSHRLLNNGRCKGNHTLYGDGATFAMIIQLGILGRRRKIGMEVGVAQAPAIGAKIGMEPAILRRKRDAMTRKIKRLIQQIYVADMNGLHATSSQSENADIT